MVAERTDGLIDERAELLVLQPLLGVERQGIPGRLQILPEVSLLISYQLAGSDIPIMRALHQKQQLPPADLRLITL
ncbi:type II toxin-antitoxin system mRNA interferase toxin, RelE/StbE family [Halomonas litopenaei]|uniref:type II toxin-antitoxin system mRNA interferase toxin, RelE/StbE family n=1 Tax=Halomonas litopenaei TaxID=2109328 RepID=UPI003FA1763C